MAAKHDELVRERLRGISDARDVVLASITKERAIRSRRYSEEKAHGASSAELQRLFGGIQECDYLRLVTIVAALDALVNDLIGS